MNIIDNRKNLKTFGMLKRGECFQLSYKDGIFLKISLANENNTFCLSDNSCHTVGTSVDTIPLETTLIIDK